MTRPRTPAVFYAVSMTVAGSAVLLSTIILGWYSASLGGGSNLAGETYYPTMARILNKQQSVGRAQGPKLDCFEKVHPEAGIIGRVRSPRSLAKNPSRTRGGGPASGASGEGVDAADARDLKRYSIRDGAIESAGLNPRSFTRTEKLLRLGGRRNQNFVPSSVPSLERATLDTQPPFFRMPYNRA